MGLKESTDIQLGKEQTNIIYQITMQSENFFAPYAATNSHSPFLVHVNLKLVGISPLHAAS